ncbi:hypothetical protein SEA_WATERT_57 [Microbacterium phage WaterT]|nr:hypothetical protein SEA_WATERT_57 [Microbacterium phage WaterT]
MMRDYQNNEEKLEAIQEVLGELFGYTSDTYILDKLMYIDSICDVPLEGEF